MISEFNISLLRVQNFDDFFFKNYHAHIPTDEVFKSSVIGLKFIENNLLKILTLFVIKILHLCKLYHHGSIDIRLENNSISFFPSPFNRVSRNFN